MTLPPDLSSIGLIVAICWMQVDASGVDNGIARLIMQFAFGFNSDRNSLVGMPREEAELDDDEAERQRRIDEERIYEERETGSNEDEDFDSDCEWLQEYS
jgi:hypothetical protein